MTEPTIPEKKPFPYVVGVIATPQGLGFLDTGAIETQTGYSICSAWRTPGELRPLPRAVAITVAPATFNTVNKWAAGGGADRYHWEEALELLAAHDEGGVRKPRPSAAANPQLAHGQTRQ
ncbi:hypothetical protein R6V09_05760 [Streptomyces sp. W16]|nr:hypothetical protein [Streptomyces sp. W16]MDV9169643.1 hypothetical protein [Streptomyces sp. W16]